MSDRTNGLQADGLRPRRLWLDYSGRSNRMRFPGIVNDMALHKAYTWTE
jgi:hypothetical protein